jgi:hypothetical protein
MTSHFQNLAIFLKLFTPVSEEKVEKEEITKNSIRGAPMPVECCINRFPAPLLGFVTSHFQIWPFF